MKSETTQPSGDRHPVRHASIATDFVTMSVCDQIFGIPVLEIQDILDTQRITYVPLAPVEIVGSLNLRGRVVTAMDIRLRLGLPARPAEHSSMSVVVQYEGELYSLIVDHVGEVMSLPAASYENNLSMLPPHWKEVMKGIFRLDERLLLVLDVGQLLRIGPKQNFTN
jgi:purine-binding chemotaxis protein CheW